MSECEEYRKMIRDDEEEIARIKAWPSVDIPTAAKDRETIENLKRDIKRLKGKLEHSLRRGGC